MTTRRWDTFTFKFPPRNPSKPESDSFEKGRKILSELENRDGPKEEVKKPVKAKGKKEELGNFLDEFFKGIFENNNE
jgi:hypothetical protein